MILYFFYLLLIIYLFIYFILFYFIIFFSSTWDEHLFELLLPAGASGTGAVQVGHIDLKLNFVHSPPNPLPVLQVNTISCNVFWNLY